MTNGDGTPKTKMVEDTFTRRQKHFWWKWKELDSSKDFMSVKTCFV
jgi:hypothetical protein